MAGRMEDREGIEGGPEREELVFRRMRCEATSSLLMKNSGRSAAAGGGRPFDAAVAQAR
jgi:hypothetical protein